MENQKAPIFEYDDRYIAESKYTREELYKLQEMVLEQIEKNPATYKYELKKIKEYDEQEFEAIFTMITAQKIQKEKSKNNN